MTNARLTSLLKSCGAFEAYRRQESDELRPDRVVSFLLLERRLPRAVCFCLELSLSAIRAISGGAVRPERAIGRVFAELAFTEMLRARRVDRAPARPRPPRNPRRRRRDRGRLLHHARDPARTVRAAQQQHLQQQQ